MAAPPVAGAASPGAGAGAGPGAGRGQWVGLIASVLGAVGVIVTTAVQVNSINHSSTGQALIDSQNLTTAWSVAIGATVLCIGAVLYFVFKEVTVDRYIYVYGFAFSAYLVSTIALYMSTIQVIVREKS